MPIVAIQPLCRYTRRSN